MKVNIHQVAFHQRNDVKDLNKYQGTANIYTLYGKMQAIKYAHISLQSLNTMALLLALHHVFVPEKYTHIRIFALYFAIHIHTIADP